MVGPLTKCSVSSENSPFGPVGSVHWLCSRCAEMCSEFNNGNDEVRSTLLKQLSKKAVAALQKDIWENLAKKETSALEIGLFKLLFFSSRGH